MPRVRTGGLGSRDDRRRYSCPRPDDVARSLIWSVVLDVLRPRLAWAEVGVDVAGGVPPGVERARRELDRRLAVEQRRRRGLRRLALLGSTLPLLLDRDTDIDLVVLYGPYALDAHVYVSGHDDPVVMLYRDRLDASLTSEEACEIHRRLRISGVDPPVLQPL